MVVSNVKNEKIKQMDQQSLKFGMDRILSENISSGNSKLEGSLEGCTRSPESPGYCCLSVPCLSGPPCAGCISSLYRCCRMSSSLGNGNFFGSEIHAPQPFRSYTNGDPNIHQNHGDQQPVTAGGGSKKKRSWSRAVFSNLQRKGLEKRFQLQKYITKPDRRQLAATLGLTDAQVKVWFQNRRMKWRHTKESSAQSQAPKGSGENILVSADSTQTPNSDSECESEIDVQTFDG